MNHAPVTEAELHAYVDGRLPDNRRAVVEAHLAEHPQDDARVAGWRRQKQALHACFDPVVAEPVPERLQKAARMLPSLPLLRHAAALGWIAVGAVAGWYVHGWQGSSATAPTAALVHQAAIAHAVYTPEVRHPVEVGADDEAHLVAWLSKRLGAKLKVPHLSAVGYQLVGGRLLPGNQGPVAQFMFQDGNGQRLTLYLVTASGGSDTAFRFGQERGVSVFYWLDGKFAYALSGEVEKDELLRVAQAVYQQYNR
jgi:anti-sigma factor RsiW